MSKPKVKMVGEDSNAFSILGRCQRTARKAGWNKEQIEEFMRKAADGDYDHLLRTVMEEFDTDGDSENDWEDEDTQDDEWGDDE